MSDLQLLRACADCQIVEASVEARKRWLCLACFIKYVSSKPIKRIESYRLNRDASEQPQRLLLPVSGGVSSVVLLQIMDQLLQRQLMKRGRTTYELLVLVVEMPSSHDDRSIPACYNALKQKFPCHTFSSLPLSTLFELDLNISEDIASLTEISQTGAQAGLEGLLSTAMSASTRADLLDILLTRLVVAFAKANACAAVLWGHSNSRLAAKSLTAVAEGRGASLPLQISDGLSPWGLHFYYPLRELFKPELVAYANILPGTLSAILNHGASNGMQPTSMRNTSINDLLARYIHSQGEKYPSIVANVVRTASKLQAPAFPTQVSKCSICAMPRRVDDICQTQEDGGEDIAGLCFACHRYRNEITSRDIV